jgi:hypothetical protein
MCLARVVPHESLNLLYSDERAEVLVLPAERSNENVYSKTLGGT